MMDRLISFRATAWSAINTPLSLTLTVVALAAIVQLAMAAAHWFLLNAVWPWQGAELCAVQNGICWPFLGEKLRFILFGTYPFEEHWRPALASILLCALAVQTGLQMVGRGVRLGTVQTLVVWTCVLAVAFLLMAGGLFGLPPVDSIRWNGLPILLILSIAAIALAFPLGLLLALARSQSQYRLLSGMATTYIELTRAVPMLTVLFVGIFVLPLMLPPGVKISPVVATLVALIFFHASYFAEDLRGGMQSLSAGQEEAAKALGLSYWKRVGLIVMPQAIQRSLPSLVNTIIGAYKDTSLVVVLGIHDLTATARMAFSDPGWRGYALEAYFIVGLWFLVSCAFLSAIGRELHRGAQKN